MIDQTIRMTFDSLWDKGKRSTVTADTDLERVLVDGARIPLLYWRQNFFFMGTKNEGLSTLTRGEFPAKADPAGSHPVFALKPVAGGAGFRVCPCSSKEHRPCRCVAQGTALLYSGYIMEKSTYFIEQIRFNIPASTAAKLYFKGEIPDEKIITRAGVADEKR